MPSKVENAVDTFQSGYNCAQSVLFAFRDEVGLEEDMALKMACGLGAGMGRKQEVCGAVTGGILVLGLRHGRGSRDDRSAAELTYEKTRDLMDRFEQRRGSCLCRELLGGCDLSSESGRREFMDRGLLNAVCKECVAAVVEILDEIK